MSFQIHKQAALEKAQCQDQEEEKQYQMKKKRKKNHLNPQWRQNNQRKCILPLIQGTLLKDLKIH